MSSYRNTLVTCPYNEAHRLKESRLQIHIAKCKLDHLDKQLETCPFNATHLYEHSERDYHLLSCPDKAPLDRKMAQSLDKNNPFKGRTDVPSYSEPRQMDLIECWDNEISENASSGYVPPAPPPGAIIQPRPMAKPAERKQMYKNLHKMHNEADSAETSPSSKSVSVPRQPKQPSAAARSQSIQQQHNMQDIQNLGLGRGKPSRIAANIWNKTGSENSQLNNEIINGMSNLGLGRGQGSSQGFVPTLDDDDEFPALGCGRGAFRIPKQNLRSPGVKPRN